MRKPNLPLSVSSLLRSWPANCTDQLKYCVGLSGGIDSVVLLHLIHNLAKLKPLAISAIHVNHGLLPEAEKWTQFCEQLCKQWQIPFISRHIQVIKTPGDGLENSARKLRYQEYAKSGADVIILAHHHDDQIETLFSQFLRGSDLHNLAGMPELRLKGKQQIWRPLLGWSKKHLIEYAAQHGLAHIEDSSNHDNQYLRNFVRNLILPQLTNYDPHITTKLFRSLTTLQNAASLQDEVAASDLANCHTGEGLALAHYKQLSTLRQLNLLSYYLRKQSFALPTTAQLSEFNRQVIYAKSDTLPQLMLNHDHYLVRQNNLIKIKAKTAMLA